MLVACTMVTHMLYSLCLLALRGKGTSLNVWFVCIDSVVHSEDMVCRLYLHGPGGGGKTCMLKAESSSSMGSIYQELLEERLPRIQLRVWLAVQLSTQWTAFHLGMHFKIDKTGRSSSDAAEVEMRGSFIDEISLTPPNLLAALQVVCEW